MPRMKISGDYLVTLYCVYQRRCSKEMTIKLSPGSKGSAMCLSAEKAFQDQRSPRPKMVS